jgi:hypothetical protein
MLENYDRLTACETESTRTLTMSALFRDRQSNRPIFALRLLNLGCDRSV